MRSDFNDFDLLRSREIYVYIFLNFATRPRSQPTIAGITRSPASAGIANRPLVFEVRSQLEQHSAAIT